MIFWTDMAAPALSFTKEDNNPALPFYRRPELLSYVHLLQI